MKCLVIFHLIRVEIINSFKILMKLMILIRMILIKYKVIVLKIYKQIHNIMNMRMMKK